MPKNTKRDAFMAANKPSAAEVRSCMARAEHVLQALKDSGMKVVGVGGNRVAAKDVRAVLAGAVAAPNRPSMPFGERIKAARELCGVTQDALSGSLDTTPATVERWEQSDDVSEVLLRRVAAALDMSVVDLIVGW